MGPIARLPFHPLLLAAYAVLAVYATNISEILPTDLASPLFDAVIAAALVLGFAGLAYRDLRRGAVLASAIVLAVGYFGHVGPWLAQAGLPEAAQLGLVVGLVVLAGTYAAVARGSLPNVTAALNAFGLVLVLISAATILPFESARVVQAARMEPQDAAPSATATRQPDRDIYFLVFDRYGSEWSIRERFGVSSDLAPDLEAAGFQVVPGARANYRATEMSLAATLNMQLLDDLTATMGRASSDRTPVRARLANHEVGRFLRANGYRYYHLGAWFAGTYSSPIADEVLRWGTTTEFESVLRDVSIVPALDSLMGSTPADTKDRDSHRNHALFQFRQVRRLAGVPGRKFVFAHILLPHPPYVLGEGGRMILEAEADSQLEAELYDDQLHYTDDRIRETVAALLSGPDDEDPIVVITADEGPYICFELDCVDHSPETNGIRFGTLRAYYLPGLDYRVPPDDSGVNIFRMILREYFGADLPDLPNRSYDWPDDDHLYDYTDITDELPLPDG